MTDLFNFEFFANNRAQIRQSTGAKIIVLSANGLLQRSADTTFPFRQDSNFWYFTGIEEAGYTLVMLEEEEFLIEPKRSEHRDLWDGAIDKQKLINRSGIENILDYHTGWIKLDKKIKEIKKIHTIAPAEPYFEHFGFYANPSRAALLSHLEKHKNAQVVDIRKQIARLRQIKQQPEILAIQEAIDISIKAIEKVINKINKYKNEREVVAELTKDFINSGASGHAYSPIVAYGLNAATIHYVDTDSPVGKNGLLLMDVGAEYSNYSADITRTVAVGTPTKRVKEVYKSVETVKKFATSKLKPGIKMRDFEKLVDMRMGEELVNLGLIKDPEDKKGIKKYYPHLVSHHLGLDTHDAADYDLPLEQNMVVTLEPGIYIPEESIGIRIEDDMLITKNGCKNLSQSLSAKLG